MSALFLKQRLKKGFTLVEVIIVLVIIALIAAIATPALTGYIQQADDKSLISEAKSLYSEVQAALFECFMLNEKPLKNYLEVKASSGNNFYYDEDKNKVYTGRFSNSSLRDVQIELAGKTKHKPENEWDFQIARTVLRYIDSEYLDSAKYKFNYGNGLGKSGLTTPKKYFDKCPLDEISIVAFYNDQGQLLKFHYAKKGFDKVISFVNGEYSIETSATGIYDK